MRAVIQRVMKASVTVGDELVSSIGRGLCILVGISREDNTKDIEYLVRKILNLRVFEDDSGKRWMKSVKDLQLEVLCVSQFTLYSVLKGNKPDFHQAMGGDESQAFYSNFVSALKAAYQPERVKDGKFGAYMQVHIENDGPVTIQLDAPAHAQGDSKCKGRQGGYQKVKGQGVESETSTSSSQADSACAMDSSQQGDSSLAADAQNKLDIS